MSAVTFEVTPTDERNRLTVGFRMILAIPHLIVSQVWGTLAEVLGLLQWFVIVFTGKRNKGMWDLQRSWFGYAGRVHGYVGLLYDTYPAFGPEPAAEPVRVGLDYEEPANRLTSGLRFLWVIPALLLMAVLAIGAVFVVLASWFAILFTGRHPAGMWGFIHRVTHYQLQLQAYTLLMTDTYPKYSKAAA